MHRFGAVVFTLVLLTPLCGPLGLGYDAVRLSVALGLVALLLLRAGASLARRRERRGASDPLLTAALLLAAATILSVTQVRSVWDAAAPVMVLLAGIAVYAFASGGFLARGYVFSAGLWAIAGGGLAFAFLGLHQRLVLGRPAVSAEGNTNYAGALAGMLLPAAAAFVLVKGPRWRRALAAVSAAALLALLVLTESRGGLAGAAAGVLVAGGALVWRRVPWARPWMGATLAALLVVPLVGFGARHLSPERGRTLGVRLEIWKSAGRMFLDHPALGIGPGGFQAEYPPYRSEEEYQVSNPDPPGDFREVEDAHSSWVGLLVETGAPGLLLFLLVVYVAARLWRHYVKTAPDADATAALAGLGGGAAAYLVAGLANALTLHASHTILFWAFLGLIELMGNARARERRRRAGDLAVALPLAASIAAALGMWLAVSRALLEADFRAALELREPASRAAALDALAREHPEAWLVHFHRGRALAELGRHGDAADACRAVLERRPFHLGALNNLALALHQGPGGPEEAERALMRAVEIGPYYWQSHYNLGVLRLLQGRNEEAEQGFARSVEARERHGPSHYGLGLLLLRRGEAARAVERLRRARELGVDVASRLRTDLPAAPADERLAEFFR